MKIDDDALASFIASEGTPIRLQIGENQWVTAGWIDEGDMRVLGVGPAVAQFLREAADAFEDVQNP